MVEMTGPASGDKALDPNALRIVLFGLPLAGKTSILAALAEASQTQEKLLEGRLTDSSRGLEALRHQLYEGQPGATSAELVPYPVTFEPLSAVGESLEKNPISAVLFDSDGEAANELLSRRRSLATDGARNGLVRAVLEADALVLVFDVSAPATHSDSDFAAFFRFLQLFQQNRRRRAEVAGLPIYLVLTKCDLLAGPSDTMAAWTARIEERQAQVEKRFREFLVTQHGQGPIAFGGVHLRLWATSVKMPSLADHPAQPHVPHGIAELFHQVFQEARAFRRRRRQAAHRLLLAATGCVAVLAATAALIFLLLNSARHDDPNVRELLTAIDSYRAREATTPSGRLREPLQVKISELTDLENRSAFAGLPEETKLYVAEHLQELQDYKNFKEKLAAIPQPAGVRNEADLADVEKALKALQIPAEHARDWSQTEAALAREQRLEDCQILRAAVAETTDWYNQLLRRGDDLWTFSARQQGAPLSWADWHTQVQALLEEAQTLPRRTGERSPGSRLTHDSVLHFERTAAARTAWESLRARLLRLRDLSTALGLAGAKPGRSPLDIPPAFQAAQARARLQELERVYPHYREDFTLSDLPEAAAAEIRSAATARYKHLIHAGRAVVLTRLQEAGSQEQESLDGWRRLIPWLEQPDELRAWRVLAQVLARLQDPEALDPVDALLAFLKRDQFDLVLTRLTLEVPDSLRVRPDGRWVIHHQRAGGSNPAAGDNNAQPRAALVFELAGDEKHDVRRQTTRYVFRPSAGVTLTYRPGESFWADLPVKRAKTGAGGLNSGTTDPVFESDWFFTWARARSLVYQFECLSWPPRLHRKDQENTQGEIAEGVVVEISPEKGLPAIPDLLPEVPLKRDRP
jgi:hypothetical protein